VAHFRKRSPKAVYIVLVLLVVAVSFLARSHVASRSAAKPATGTGKVTAAKTVEDQHNDHHQGGAVTQRTEHDLNIAAIDRTWILIKFNDGREEEMVLRPGEIKSWRFADKASLRIGNAGGIKVIFDGKDMGVLGLSGQVKSLSFPDNQKSNG
jgi:Na+-transporting methylmalonyl-CoA/oxaloacetate decarboxylase gamma subunit